MFGAPEATPPELTVVPEVVAGAVLAAVAPAGIGRVLGGAVVVLVVTAGLVVLSAGTVVETLRCVCVWEAGTALAPPQPARSSPARMMSGGRRMAAAHHS
jgi:hypothetical protein